MKKMKDKKLLYEYMQENSYYRDRCHLTDEGYRKLGKNIWKPLEK